MFIEVLFTIDRNWREPKCASNGAWIKTALHPYNGTLNSNKRNRLLLYTITWTNLKCILLSERSQNQKLGILRFQNFMSFWKRQNNRDRKHLGVGVKGGQQHKETYGAGRAVLLSWLCGSYMTICICQNS